MGLLKLDKMQKQKQSNLNRKYQYFNCEFNIHHPADCLIIKYHLMKMAGSYCSRKI